MASLQESQLSTWQTDRNTYRNQHNEMNTSLRQEEKENAARTAEFSRRGHSSGAGRAGGTYARIRFFQDHGPVHHVRGLLSRQGRCRPHRRFLRGRGFRAGLHAAVSWETVWRRTENNRFETTCRDVAQGVRETGGEEKERGIVKNQEHEQ